MRSPDKYIREAYLTALTDQGLTAFNKDIPVSSIPPPQQYVLIESQSRNTTERSKESFEYICLVVLHIISINTRGYSATSIVDDMEETCINAIEAGIIIDHFVVKSTYQVESKNLDMTYKTGSVERRVLVYEHWVAEVDPLNDTNFLITSNNEFLITSDGDSLIHT